MKRKATLRELELQLAFAIGRTGDNNFMVRMCARTEVKKLESRIKRLQREEAK